MGGSFLAYPSLNQSSCMRLWVTIKAGKEDGTTSPNQHWGEKWHVRPTPYRNWHTRNDSTATRLGDNTTKIYFVSIQQFLIQYHLTSIFRCYTFCFKFQLRPRKKCSLEYVQSYSSFQDWENVIQVTFPSLQRWFTERDYFQSQQWYPRFCRRTRENTSWCISKNPHNGLSTSLYVSEFNKEEGTAETPWGNGTL